MDTSLATQALVEDEIRGLVGSVGWIGFDYADLRFDVAGILSLGRLRQSQKETDGEKGYQYAIRVSS